MVDEKSVARHTGAATAMVGVANTGVITGPVTVAGRPVARSVYWRQAQRIKPDRLLGREPELAGLTEFCATPVGPSYLWLRAPAWAGKSALLASFASDPPTGVQVVPFFVTSRWAEQNDRMAFTDVVTEQLAELLAEPMPDVTPATRDLVFCDLLERAAELCASRDERLVLMVDGLDEDRGVVAGPDAHSIAALLPASVPAGLRVVVSGRPSPPVPADVPDRHPLRDPAIVRDIEPSPQARAVRADMLGELDRLLYGSRVERDLVGLVASARGGLSARDIAELTGLSVHEVHRNLNTVTGRTFMGRPGRWITDTDVYVLGHEDLQATATEELGADGLARHRRTLHAWADGYRERSWPVDTPEYLLRGYFRLLQQERDLDRMLRCGTDTARHNRMLDLTGGDSAALAEIAAAADTFAALDPPDLAAVGRLGVHYDALSGRNADIPEELPSVWASVGHVERAENLADSITDPLVRVSALVQTAEQVRGDGGRARSLVRRALTVARSIRETGFQARALAAVTTALIGVGLIDDARRVLAGAIGVGLGVPRLRPYLMAAAASFGEAGVLDELAEACTDPKDRSDVFAVAAQNRAQAGDPDQVEDLLARIEPPDRRAWALGMVASGFLSAGERERVTDFVERAEGDAMLVSDEESRSHMFGQLAYASASVGDRVRAERLLHKAVTTASHVKSGLRHAPIARTIAVLGRWDEAVRFAGRDSGVLAEIAEVAARAGRTDRADEVVGAIKDVKERLAATTLLARIAADAGDRDRAIALAEEVATTARSTAARFPEPKTLTAIATALTGAGQVSKAVALAGAIQDDHARNQALSDIARTASVADRDAVLAVARSIGELDVAAAALASIAMTAAEAGDVTGAAELAEAAVAAAIALDSSFGQLNQLGALAVAARTMAVAGQPERAAGLAELLTEEPFRERVRSSAAAAAARAGRFDDAVTIAATATQERDRTWTLAVVAEAAADAGQLEIARNIVTGLNAPHGWAADTLAYVHAALGDRDRALAIVDRLESEARAIDEARWHDERLVDAAQALVHAGGADELLSRFGEIVALAEDTGGRRWRQAIQHSARQVLAAAALWYAKAGRVDKVLEFADLIGGVRERVNLLGVGLPRADALAGAAVELVSSVGVDEALAVARSVGDLTREATALASIAALVGPPDDRRLVAEAIRTGGLVPCLGVLATVDSHAVVAVADEVTRLIGSASTSTSVRTHSPADHRERALVHKLARAGTGRGFH